MTTLTIEISDEQAQQLAEEALHMNVTPESLASKRLGEAMMRPKPNFRQIGREIIAENTELYRRLA